MLIFIHCSLSYRNRPRRSWFDKEGDSATSRNPFSVSAKNEFEISDYDVMVLDHFSRPPKIDFGETRQGRLYVL